MNKVTLIGRLTRDPEVRYTQGDNLMAIARFSLAVPRKIKQENQPDCDFINCVSFGKSAEFAERYFRKGIKIAVTGRIQTGNYTNKDGVKVYTTDVIIEEQEFCESKNVNQSNEDKPQQQSMVDSNGFMNIPDGIDEELPFN